MTSGKPISRDSVLDARARAAQPPLLRRNSFLPPAALEDSLALLEPVIGSVPRCPPLFFLASRAALNRSRGSFGSAAGVVAIGAVWHLRGDSQNTDAWGLSVEVETGFEPVYAALQAATSPLGHSTASTPNRSTSSGRRDSNPRPSPWQGDALPAALRPRDLSVESEPYLTTAPDRQ